jgi:rod shape-determining protein MreD
MAIEKQNWRDVMLGVLGRLGIIVLVLFVLLTLSAFPIQAGNLGAVRPVFILIAIYYWAITRPDMLPPLGVFATGIVFDLVCGYPLGMTALTLLVVQWVIRLQRKFLSGQPFRVIWAGMAVVALAAGLAQWLLFSLFYLSIVPPLPVLISAAVTAAVFPLVVLPLAKLNKVLAEKAATS